MTQKVVGFYTEKGKVKPIHRKNARCYTSPKHRKIRHKPKYARKQEQKHKDKRRIGDYLEDKETEKIAGHLEPFFDDRTPIKPIVATTKIGKKGYEAQETQAPNLHPSKVSQRKIAVDRMPKGTVLELYAGKGFLTKIVYAGKAGDVILVDKDRKALKQADRKLKGRVKRKLYAENNVKWIRKEMQKEDLSDLVLVDFDAFGTPTEAMSAFFDNYKVRKPLYVSLTDGSARYYGLNKNGVGPRSARRRYHAGFKRDFGTVRGQVKMIEKFMEKEGEKHRFKAEPVSIAKGRSHVVYATYRLSPGG
jgi:tRNA G26 N,N-dimethylase Trm1